ncbi:hypothetical protein XELAEV_18006759mg [Xenopus laevis]|uniref:Uncharacterized protein n=1 Tax=Xenopus laevis TaxID=8355 RepID=A0A974DZE0_XENLA|nr:hypothetical protein XELAEV_18006759mg [Xenopus laevis]
MGAAPGLLLGVANEKMKGLQKQRDGEGCQCVCVRVPLFIISICFPWNPDDPGCCFNWALQRRCALSTRTRCIKKMGGGGRKSGGSHV